MLTINSRTYVKGNDTNLRSIHSETIKHIHIYIFIYDLYKYAYSIQKKRREENW